MLGIRDVSRNLQFLSSYTLVVHAPWDSFQLEILPKALAEAERLRAAVSQGRWDEIVEILGGSMAQTPGEDAGEENAEYTSYEHTVVEAALKVDSSGSIAMYPFINDQLNRMLARWTFKLSTGGGFKLPAFALADDGYLSSVRGSGGFRVRLDSKGSRYHLASVQTGLGGALPDPNVRRFASLRAAIGRRCGNAGLGPDRRADRRLDGSSLRGGPGGAADQAQMAPSPCTPKRQPRMAGTSTST